MARNRSDVWIAGVDGCKGGWLAVLTRPDGTGAHARPVFQDFGELLKQPEAPAVIAVDIPIGLPQHSFGGRAADGLARKLLGRRGSSVFSMPSRAAVFAAPGPYPSQKARLRAYQRACVIAERTSTPPKRITIFAFGLFEKIRQVDHAIRSDASYRGRVFETHPEVAFARLYGDRELPPKTTSEGLVLRRRLLISAGLPRKFVGSDAPKGANTDDLLDALACAMVACRIHNRAGVCYPDPPELDQHGLPMAIWA